MDKRRCVQEFDAGASSDEGLEVAVVASAGEEQDERTKSLATGVDETEDEIGDCRKIDVRGRHEPVFDQMEICLHCGKDVARPDAHYSKLRMAREPQRIQVDGTVNPQGV
jgi:hypothetical protein